MPVRGLGIGGIGALLLALVGWYFGFDPSQLLNTTQNGAPVSAPGSSTIPANDQAAQFVSVVLADTEDVWTELFKGMNRTYEKPKLVLFSGRVDSACGLASAAVGPFYCPEDKKVYLDLRFFDELSSRFGASGDFARAYVIAHEIGHHVQNLLGTSERMREAQARGGKAAANQLSVRMELQADFLAGVWAHHAQKMRHILESGDIEEALNAASAIGDDRLQKQSQGYVVPESFTHGTAAQRASWFRKGFETGDIAAGDTFAKGAL